MDNLTPQSLDQRSLYLTIAKGMLFDVVTASEEHSFSLGINLARNAMVVEIPFVQVPANRDAYPRRDRVEAIRSAESIADCADWICRDEEGLTAVAMIRNLEPFRTAIREARAASKKRDMRAALETALDYIEFALVDLNVDGTVSWVNGNFVVTTPEH